MLDGSGPYLSVGSHQIRDGWILYLNHSLVGWWDKVLIGARGISPERVNESLPAMADLWRAALRSIHSLYR